LLGHAIRLPACGVAGESVYPGPVAVKPNNPRKTMTSLINTYIKTK
jgi:hypothetical protein